MNKTLGLYIHIPFCEKKCGYCDFYSLPGADEAAMGGYIKALISQMEDYSLQAARFSVDTVFIGGGTPSLLSSSQFEELFKALRRCFSLAPAPEITVECNPASAMRPLFDKLLGLGVNRLSLGLQSADDGELSRIGRLHDFNQFYFSYRDARYAGFDNINVDLMYGLPGQTPGSFADTLRCVTSLSPEHLSCYGLKLEEGTPLWKERESLPLPDEETERSMYFLACSALSEAGYRHYEISNFARPGYECRHNLRYWDCGEYLGFGPAASCYFSGKRFTYKRDLEAFVARDPGDSLVEELFEIPPSEMVGEYVMLRLRLRDGISPDEFHKRFRRDFEAMFGDKLQRYLDSGHMVKQGGAYSLTDEGFYISNYIIADLLSI